MTQPSALTTTDSLCPTRPTYDNFRVGLPVRARQALQLLKGCQLGAVLDLDCADSGRLGVLPKSCKKVGIDNAPKRFRPDDIRFVQTDVVNHHLPFEHECFDAVYDDYKRFVFGRLAVASLVALTPWSALPKGNTHVYVLLTLGTPLLLLFGLASAANVGPRRGALTRPQRLLLLYMCGTVFYVAVVGNSLEVGENTRFRFMTDTFLVVTLGLALQSFRGRSSYRDEPRSSSWAGEIVAARHAGLRSQ
jgi:hypothetical protein